MSRVIPFQSEVHSQRHYFSANVRRNDSRKNIGRAPRGPQTRGSGFIAGQIKRAKAGTNAQSSINFQPQHSVVASDSGAARATTDNNPVGGCENSSTRNKITQRRSISNQVQAVTLGTHLLGDFFGNPLDDGGWLSETMQASFEDPAAGSPHHNLKKGLLLAIQGLVDGITNHWSLVVAAEGQRGNVYQVKGSPLDMVYMPVANANILASASLRKTVMLNHDITDRMHARIKEIASSEEPPHSTRGARIVENCQGWVLRVVARLVQEKIVREAKYNEIKLLQQPIKLI